MIDRWANLLASAAQEVKVQPRFVGILDELAGSQAECLERLAFARATKIHFPAAEFADSCFHFAEYYIAKDLEVAMRKMLTNENQIAEALNKIVNTFDRARCFIRSSNY